MVDQLSTLIEVAIAIAGFTGVAMALTRSREEFGFFDRVNIWFIFGHSVTVYIAAQSVSVLSLSTSIDVALEIAYPIYAVLAFFLIIVATYAILQLRNRDLRDAALATIPGRLVVFVAYTSGVAATVALTLASFNLINQSQALYVGLVASLLLLALMHFAYFISRSIKTLSSRR